MSVAKRHYQRAKGATGVANGLVFKLLPVSTQKARFMRAFVSKKTRVLGLSPG